MGVCMLLYFRMLSNDTSIPANVFVLDFVPTHRYRRVHNKHLSPLVNAGGNFQDSRQRTFYDCD